MASHKTLLAIAMAVAASGWAHPVRADLSAPAPFGDEAFLITTFSASDLPTLLGSVPNEARAPVRPVATHAATGVDIGYLTLGFSQDDWAIFPAAGDFAEEAASSRQVIELPPSPSSAALFLSAMLSAGAWHLARSARHLHLSHLPDWYHTGGPSQIGQAVPFDFDFATPPPCCFEQPVGECRVSYLPWQAEPPRHDLQHFIPAQAPRGPPAS